MPLYFDDSTPERQKAARRRGVKPLLERSVIPPAKPYTLLTKEEIWNGPSRRFVFDVESYPNYFVAGFKCLDTDKVIYFEDDEYIKVDCDFLSYMLFRHLFIGFNSANYDVPMIGECLKGIRAEQLKEISNQIIYAEERPKFDQSLNRINHIDLIEPLPLKGSLKLYAGRCHADRLQDLPYEHDRILSNSEKAIVRDYNLNDLDLTKTVYLELKPFIELREQLSSEYRTDFRSKSDSQIAENILVTEIRKTGQKVGKSPWVAGDTFKYQTPSNLYFQSPQLQKVLEVVQSCTFSIEPNGYSNTPREIEQLDIRIGDCKYKMGSGGLHSSETALTIYSTDDFLILDRDVASYYPNIKLKVGLFPKHIGPIYLEVYRDRIVMRRLNAKAAKRMAEADGLKIAANGSFGKNGNPYSLIYAPDVLLHVTLSGQLYLLMFIETLTQAGFRVVSGNTDGVVSYVPTNRYDEFCSICTDWENRTGFVTEETQYKSLHARDVNNYIAVKKDNTTKTKGYYSEVGSALNSILSKNPETFIVSDAIQAYVGRGIPIEQTIRNCQDIRRFLTVRNVRGGAEKDGQYLGRVVRWYYSNTVKGTINYVTTGNTVAKTEGANPCMLIYHGLPNDLDYDWYINETIKNLYELGIYKQAKAELLI